MPSLYVEDFSCIRRAEMQTGPLTVIIGPQGSGKSLLSKLLYFFLDALSDVPRLVEEGATLDKSKRAMDERFRDWFPEQAWGDKQFTIEFTMGDVRLKLLRGKYAGNVKNTLRITTTGAYETLYAQLSSLYKSAQKQTGEAGSLREVDAYYLIARRFDIMLAKFAGSSPITRQIFIPAGRSFFTGAGKAMIAFDQGGLMDEFTLRFGRYFVRAREMSISRLRRIRHEDVISADLASELVGGTVRFERTRDYVLTADGRELPFGTLSSGQQEVLPLIWTLNSRLGLRPSQTSDQEMVYIEEPEAHLFPTAQSKLVEALVRLVSGPSRHRQMIITTHSPYVLSKINNMMLAHAVAGEGQGKAQQVRAVVEEKSWIPARSVQAYALADGILEPIVCDGLISGDYIDQVSGEISRQFADLLDIQSGGLEAVGADESV